MKKVKNIQDYRKETILNKMFRYPEGIMSRSQWLKMMMMKGWKAEEKTRRNHVAEDKMKEDLRRRKMDIPFGNPNYPTTKKWLEDKAVLEAGIFKTEYFLIKENSLYDITKTEYEYFKGLELAQDKATEQMELSYKIEAGIATDEEIEQAEEKEFEFFRKYCK